MAQLLGDGSPGLVRWSQVGLANDGDQHLLF